MDETVTADAALERGRYAVHRPEDGSIVIARQTGLCDRCLNCGCGEPGEPLAVPAAAVKMAPLMGRFMESGGGINKLRMILGRGGGDDDGDGT